MTTDTTGQRRILVTVGELQSLLSKYDPESEIILSPGSLDPAEYILGSYCFGNQTVIEIGPNGWP